MVNKEDLTSTTFHQTANLFVNAGIVGLYHFLRRYQMENEGTFPSLSYRLDKDRLEVSCERLFQLLEEVYYFMGKKVYDTWTSKQKEEASKGFNCNIYYSQERSRFYPFPKIKSYGLPELFTNGRPKNTRYPENQSKLSILEKEDPELFQEFHKEFKKRKIKPGSVIYFNEPYTTIPRLTPPTIAYLQETENGKGICSITGKSYKKLFDANNNSAFIKKQGIHNFKSFFNNSSYQLSWKAMYLIRFAPALCLYAYQNNYETLICNFFNSDTLEHLNELFDTSILRPKEELEQINYRINFRMASFSIRRKGDDDLKIETAWDAVWESEIAFMLLYTFFRMHFWKEQEENEADKQYIDPFAGHPLEQVPITLATFRADKFASTLRPNFYEEYNSVKFVIRLIAAVEKAGISISTVWQSLKITNSKIQKLDVNKRYAAERQIRADILEKLIRGQSIVTDMEQLFFKCYKYLLARETIGFHNYGKLLGFLTLYEKAIKFGNHKIMNEALQQRAINLGKSLSYGIVNFENPKDETAKQANARNGRKYIIRLHKARTLEQFTEAMISIMKKYGISLSNELLENLGKDNFMLIRQYTVISALNGLNRILSPSKNND